MSRKEKNRNNRPKRKDLGKSSRSWRKWEKKGKDKSGKGETGSKVTSISSRKGLWAIFTLITEWLTTATCSAKMIVIINSIIVTTNSTTIIDTTHIWIWDIKTKILSKEDLVYLTYPTIRISPLTITTNLPSTITQTMVFHRILQTIAIPHHRCFLTATYRRTRLIITMPTNHRTWTFPLSPINPSTIHPNTINRNTRTLTPHHLRFPTTSSKMIGRTFPLKYLWINRNNRWPATKTIAKR